VDIGAVLPAHRQALEGVQPGEGALHHPADRAEPGAMRDAPAGNHRLDPASPQLPAVGVMVITPIGVDCIGSAARPAGLAAYRWDGVQQRQQLGDVVAVAAGDGDRQRDPVGVGQQVVLGAWLATVDRAGPDRLVRVPLICAGSPESTGIDLC
jgi:hypothetical protein